MSDNKSPWGQGPKKPSGNNSPWGSGGNKPDRNRPKPGESSPDLENVIQGFTKRVRGGGPRRGGNGFGGNGPLEKFGPLGMFVIVGVVVLALSCVYQVSQQEEAVVLRFGEYSRTTTSGLNFKLPTPIETVHKIDVTTQRAVGSNNNLVLTGDESIANVDFTVRWNIKSAEDYLFNLEYPEKVVEDAADSAMREVFGKKELDFVLSEQRGDIQPEIKILLQEMVDKFNSGINITVVQLQDTKVPPPVLDAFTDVQNAKQERGRSEDVGDAHRNEVLEKAVGEQAKLLESAQAYREEVVAVAKGETDRFTAVYREYKRAPEVTRQRIYLETIEEVYGDADKIILDSDAGSGIVPYLPLDQLSKKSGGQ